MSYLIALIETRLVSTNYNSQLNLQNQSNSMKFGAIILVGNEVFKKKNWNVAVTTSAMATAPASSKMLGRFMNIASLTHKNLCKYLDFIRCQTIPHGIIIVCEHYSDQYIKLQKRATPNFGVHFCFSVAMQICDALEFCHSNSIVIGSLCLENILICNSSDKGITVKIAHFGLYQITGNNKDIEEVIGSPFYIAPECLINEEQKYNYHTDIWSVGIMLVEIFMGWQLAQIWTPKQYLALLSSITFKTKLGSCLPSLLDSMANTCPATKTQREMLTEVYPLAERCLDLSPTTRPDSSTLLQLLRQTAKQSTIECSVASIDESIEAIKDRISHENGLAKFGFNEHTINEMFFLWKLCGSSVETILTSRFNVIQNRAPILTMPRLLVDDFRLCGNEKTRKVISFLTISELPSTNLIERLNEFSPDALFLSVELLNGKINEEFSTFSHQLKLDKLSQSLVVKERDIDYQFKRMRLFRRLLSSWPYKSDLLCYESQKDIPPVYRGAVWAALLGVHPFYEDRRHELFNKIDTYSEHHSDRQLQVDIPRCHQYDELMSSPIAHYRLKLLIKTLLISRNDDHYVYWQGLDSLSAPFLILHFNDLPTAFRCLNAFIERYLCGFFVRDNSTVIRNYLAEFMRALEFSDLELFRHLISLDFHPELFAIPWFLTCFAHVLPLHKLFHLWDSLLIADAQFPLFIGVAILVQLKPRLISVNFNEAILLFSDLPDLKIDDIVQIARMHYLNWKAQDESI